MSETQEGTAGRCSRCLRFMFCCYPRQTGSDDERRPLLDPIGSSNLNSNSQSNEDEHRTARNSVSHDGHESFSEESEERHARSNQQLNQTCRECSVQIVSQESSSQTSSVKPIKQKSQTIIDNWEIQNSLVQQENLEGQTSSVQLANQESPKCSDQQDNPDSQTSSVQPVNCETKNCSDQQQIKSFPTSLKEKNVECQAVSIIQECEQNTSKEYLKQNETEERAILRDSIFRRSLECQYGLLDKLLQNECLMVDDVKYLTEGFNTERERVNKLIEFINSSNLNKFEEGLGVSNQSHLVNFIRKNGIREPPEDNEWPVSDCEIAPIIKSYPDLVQLIYNHKLIDPLLAKNCISCWQQSKVLSKATNEEKNRELLGIMMRRSVRQLDIFICCLKDHHLELWKKLHAQDKDLFAVNLEEIYDLANTVDDIDKGKKEILHRAKELGVDAWMIDDRLYFDNKTKVDEGMTAESSGSDSQSESVVDGMKKLVIEVMGNDVEITQLVNVQKHTAGKDAWLRSCTMVASIQVNTELITGVTVVDDEIFMVEWSHSRVKVYDSHSLTASRDINIPDMTSPVGLAGCSYNKALYISHDGPRCVHRFDLTNKSVTRWKMRKNHWPQGLSVTDEHNVLVSMASAEKHDLVDEYTSEGQLVREIRFDIAIESANFYLAPPTAQLSSDRFIGCYMLGNLHRVSLTNTEGQIIKSYDGKEGGGESQLYNPSSIAIDYNSKHVFVADEGNDKLLMLDTDLTYLGQVHTPSDHQKFKLLYFDSSTDRLIVRECLGGGVLVVSPSH